MLKATKINKSYGSLPILSDVSFSIDRGNKIALVGHNGTGKTTLLKILAGIVEPDSGNIERGRATCIGYLPQDTSLVSGDSIIGYLKADTGISAIEREMEQLSSELSDPKKKERYGELQELYEKMQGYSFEHRVEIMLSGFGLSDIPKERSLSELSSGQKSKVALVGILLKGVDLLLLDEPTNNLDLPALIWLEDFLKKSKAACIIVSHDRRFLDNVAKKVFEIDWQTKALSIVSGRYSDYLEMVGKKLERAKEAFRLQQEEIGRLSDRARHLRIESARGAAWKGTDNDKFLRGFKRDRAGGSSKTAKNIEKRIDMMEKVERPIEREPFSIKLSASESPRSRDIDVVDLVFGYASGFQAGPVSFSLPFGKRVGILGLNGSGKSTLLKTLSGTLEPLKGSVVLGSGVHLGNMMQEHESLPRESTLLSLLVGKAGLEESMAYNTLVKFGFSEKQAHATVGDLSPGGRARLLLALFATLQVNVLVLDEPTNHLDLEALGALEEALSTYVGTVILVTHDRYFLEKTKVDDVYVLKDGRLDRVADYTAYLADAEAKAKQLLRLLD
jgi:ATPase subunit of ABC transporter with duplicated ATPase domains